VPAARVLVSLVRPWPEAPAPLDALEEALAAGGDDAPVFLRLSAGGPADLSRWSFLGVEPVEVATTREPPSSDAWARAAARWPCRVSRAGPRVPFGGGWAGTIGYEARSAVEATPPPRLPPDGFPCVHLARYDAVVAWDRVARRAFLAASARTRRLAAAAIERLRTRLAGARRRAASPGATPPARVRGAVGGAAYRRRVASVRERIRRGDLFQANVSQRFDGAWAGRPVDLFARLARASHAPFAGFLALGDGRHVLSASPESFLRLRGRRAETRPMKGTRPRGTTPAQDRRLRRDLETSVKDRAELAMIVDLSRNDLGRSCAPGTVRVRTARRIERYPTVFQAVAVVEGVLERGRTGLDLLRGAFPPGSVTGAPKVEAMRAIDALEGEARGPYCGAVGWFDEGGDLDLSVAIRTLALERGRVSFRVGGGVTLLSDPEEERRETVDKAAAMVEALGAARAEARR
jgi:para-aminobenzoate synthetase component 1